MKERDKKRRKDKQINRMMEAFLSLSKEGKEAAIQKANDILKK